MKHPTPEELKPLLAAVDVATWAWSAKPIRGVRNVKVDWAGAIDDLRDSWESFQRSMDDRGLTTFEEHS